MSFTDPATVTISGTPVSLPRVSVGDGKSVYRSGDGLTMLTASHEYRKRIRRMLRLDTSKIAPDAFRDDVNVELSMACYMVFDLPTIGYTPTEQLAVATALIGFGTASSNAALVKLLGGES